MVSSPVSSCRALNVAWLAPSRAVIYRLEAELHRPVQRWRVTLLMRLQQALLHPHPMESNPAWAQTGVTMLPRISFHRVRAEYQPAARLEQLLLVSSVWRDLPNARRFQGQTGGVSCEDSKNIYIWYPDQDQSRVFWRSAKSSVFSHLLSEMRGRAARRFFGEMPFL